MLDTDGDLHAVVCRGLRRHDEHPCSFLSRGLEEALSFGDHFTRAGDVAVRV